MNHPAYVHRHTIAHDFLTFGNDGIGLNRAAERRAEEQANHQVAASLAAPDTLHVVRRWLGNVLIATGTAIAGAVPSSNPEVTGRGAT